MKPKTKPTPAPKSKREPTLMELLVDKIIDATFTFTESHPVTTADIIGACENAKAIIYTMRLREFNPDAGPKSKVRPTAFS